MTHCKYNLTIISNQQLNKINTTDLIQQNTSAYGFATNTRKEVLIFQKDSKKRTIQNCFGTAESDSESVLEKCRHVVHGDTREQGDVITVSFTNRTDWS